MRYLIVDQRLPEECKITLKKEGIDPILIPPFSRLSSPIASHTDMLFTRLGNKLFSPRAYMEENQNLFEKLKGCLCGIEIVLTNDIPTQFYPSDAPMNVRIIGKNLICNERSASPELLDYAKKIGYDPLFTNQGYTACSTLPIGSESVITADKGIIKVLSKHGINVTEIKNSKHIYLPPYKYGFIGGCAFSSDDTIYFFGNLDIHENCDIIKSAIKGSGYRVVSLAPNSDKLFDLGGAYLY